MAFSRLNSKSQFLFFCVLLIFVCGVGLCYTSFCTDSEPPPSFDAIKRAHIKSDAILRDRYGNIIHELRVDITGRKLDWVPLSEVSNSLIETLIASEDKRFFRHCGFDLTALLHALFENAFTSKRRGASTITMQVAAMVDKSLKPEGKRRSVKEKLMQIKTALKLEKTWSKQQILETYINLVSFRGELIGISAASRGIFDKEPSGLCMSESLILASLVKSPNAIPEDIIERAKRLKIAINADIDVGEFQSTAKRLLHRPYSIKQRASIAPHVAHYLLKKGQTDITSTIDGKLQDYAIGLLEEYLSVLKGQNVNEGAIIVIHNQTGEILAYVGNRGISSTARYVDGIRSKRQAGSTLKPFLYALAIDQQSITASSIIENTPLDVPTERGVYRPENYDKRFTGSVTARVALASSLNVPAVKVLLMMGKDMFLEKLGELGFTKLEDSDYYGFSLALGTLDVNLFELTNAFRTLANRGVWSATTFAINTAKNNSRRVFSEEASFIVSHILSDREARSTTFSLENPLATRYWTASKTGTSKDMRDNWCIGFSDTYTVGVWVGNFSGTPMWKVSGITGAAPIWHEIMNYLHKNTTSKPPKPPEGVIRAFVKMHTGINDAIHEWFIAGTEPISTNDKTTPRRKPKIIYPPND
ncbi:MAG TPA: penicillin-binding protein 1C, partial [Syntrophorhabdaceae bacterium]|nr:penicillin-binding protein 1C [Syntrophorhabdaceae bacterium]